MEFPSRGESFVFSGISTSKVANKLKISRVYFFFFFFFQKKMYSNPPVCIFSEIAQYVITCKTYAIGCNYSEDALDFFSFWLSYLQFSIILDLPNVIKYGTKLIKTLTKLIFFCRSNILVIYL